VFIFAAGGRADECATRVFELQCLSFFVTTVVPSLPFGHFTLVCHKKGEEEWRSFFHVKYVVSCQVGRTGPALSFAAVAAARVRA
jgi:hypothetical protein